jgi:hypothetical protein
MISQQGGAGSIESTDVYSGKSASKSFPMQLYQRALPGWAYKIAEKPNAGEYRFIRFAWKAPGTQAESCSRCTMRRTGIFAHRRRR